MRHFIFFIVLCTAAVAAKANLPEPLNSYKNSYIACVNTIVNETVEAGGEVTEALLLGVCTEELASLTALIPQNMEAGFLEQLKEEVTINVQRELASGQ